MNDNQDKITVGGDAPDMVNHPGHYTGGPALGRLECLDITRWMPFTLGNAFKYTFRAGKKDPTKFVEDLEKARFYVLAWKDMEPWHSTLYHGRAPAEAFLFKTDYRQWDNWRYRTLRALVRGDADEALGVLNEQIRVAEALADEAFRRYTPEDETDDAD